MKIYKHIIPALVASLAFLSSCAKQDDAGVAEIMFYPAGLEHVFGVETKATAVEAASFTEFYAAATSGTPGSESSEWTSAHFSGTPGEAYRADEPRKWWPHDNPGFSFYGSNLPIVFDAAGSYVTASTSTDVVCAYLPNPRYLDLNTLTFNHIFARVGAVTVNAAEGYTISSASITFTPKVSGNYNLRTGAGQTDGTGWSSTTNGSASNLLGSFSTITYGTASASSTSSNDLYLVPGTYTVYATWTATRGYYTETFSSVAVDVSFTGGKINTISTTLGGLAEEIVFAVSVTPWESGSVVATWLVDPEPYSLPGEFTINSSGDKIRFSKGNLQAHLDSMYGSGDFFTVDEWKLADKQWSFCDQTFSVGNTVDYFRWVGQSAEYDSYGLLNNTDVATLLSFYGQYSAGVDETLKTDWGSIPDVVASFGNVWRTLTIDEWRYIWNSRHKGGNVNGIPDPRYTGATIHTGSADIYGLLLFPDGFSEDTPEGVTWSTINDYNTTTSSQITLEGWAVLESYGCVFLPGAGLLLNSPNNSITQQGCCFYWSSSINSGGNGYAARMMFCPEISLPQISDYLRSYGACVRLVRNCD